MARPAERPPIASGGMLRVGEVDLEVFEYGSGAAPPLMVLHDIDYLNGTEHPFIRELAKHWHVLVPSHPGFGGSSLPSHFDAIDDFAYVYLDLLRQLGSLHLIGLGFGGWIAAEVAIRCTQHVRSLVLVDALGIKVSDRTTRDIQDMFVLAPRALLELAWHDAARGEQLMPLTTANAGFDEDGLTLLLSNRRTAALVGWNPFMHSPKLRGRLRRIDRPTLVIWGASDGLVSPEYGRSFAAAIPGSRFVQVDAAGHYPYLEQPQAFVQAVEPFLEAGAHRT